MAKVLVVEDEAMLLDNILETLQLEGFEGLGAENGHKGIELARQHLPDLILCDIMMPEMDGYEVFLTLRNDPATALIPFIFLTAKADRQAMRYAMELGADDYITKPFQPDELFAAIKTRLDRQAAITREYERKLDELRGNIIHNLPHELRSPLFGVLGYSEMLMLEGPTMSRDQIVRAGQSIHEAGRRLHRLIENFLIYAQTEIMKTDLERAQIMRKLRIAQPKAFIEFTARQVAQQANREQDLQIDVADVPSLQIVQENLKKIVEELLDNAFKFSEPGTAVQVIGAVQNSHYVLLVRDHGRGLQPEQIAKIGAYIQFERRLYEQPGAGLGLIITKRLVELHGGEFAIESTPNRQTTVRVSLPLG